MPFPRWNINFPSWLLTLFAAFWIALGLRPADRKVWLTEHSFTVVFVALLVLTFRRWPLDHLSYAFVFVFLSLHTVGAHYTYAKVPYDRWVRPLFGRGLTQLLGLRRNHYDRLVHFCSGLLLAYPTWVILVRYADVRGAWSYLLAVSVVMSLSLLFELIEWMAAELLGGGAGQDYLAAQGDEWDAQKDMAAATIGAVITMTVTAVV